VVLPYLALRGCFYEVRRDKDGAYFSRLEYRNEIAIATYLLVKLKMDYIKIVKIKK